MPSYSQQNWYAPPAYPQVWTTPFAVNPLQHANAPVLGPPPSYPQAIIATPETVGDNSWYPDSGASHHLTNSPTSPSDSAPYSGSCKVYMGNVSGSRSTNQ
ncbi:hypothetical protein V6Z11_D12G227100 [Gossypium hirsutum]